VTRGSHIVVELEQPPGKDAVFSTAKSDGRVFFAVPQGRLLLIGTTDDRYDGDPGAVRPTSGDVNYLLSEARELLPGMNVTRESVRYAYAGLRPLQRVHGGPEAAISRRHAIIDHAKYGGPRKMWSIVGGKLSTFRPLARDVGRLLSANTERPRTDSSVAPGWALALKSAALSLQQKQHLRMYGRAIPDVLGLGSETICDRCGAIDGEVRYVAKLEEVSTLSDVVMRRTGLGWGAERGLCCAETVAGIVAEELSWKAAERKRQLKALREDLDANLPTAGSLEGRSA
jgi:glycerol-3-phosphate dehydrogenase